MVMNNLATATQIAAAAAVVEVTIDCPSFPDDTEDRLPIIPDEDDVNKGKPVEYEDNGTQPCCSYCCCYCGGDNLLPIIPLEEDKSIEDKKVEQLYCCCCRGDFLLLVIPSEDNNVEDESIEDKKGECICC